MNPLTPDACVRLAETIGEAPDHVIAGHALRSGRVRAFLTGSPERFDAAVVQPSLTRNDSIAFGSDAMAIAEILQHVDGWKYIEVPMSMADSVASAMEQTFRAPIKRVIDLFYVRDDPVPVVEHANVRLLTAADVELYAQSASAFEDDPAELKHNLLEGPVSAAIIDGQIVSAVEANVRTARFANLGAETLRAFRGRGLATACAAVAAQAVQQMGLTPVWSAGQTNRASCRVVEKLGFTVRARWVYLSVDR